MQRENISNKNIFLIGMMWLTVGSEIDSVKPGQDDTTWLHGDHKPKDDRPEGTGKTTQ